MNPQIMVGAANPIAPVFGNEVSHPGNAVPSGATASAADDTAPPAWPVSKALLRLLFLPLNASHREFLAAWKTKVAPLAGQTALQVFNRLVTETMRSYECDRETAWHKAKTENRSLYDEMEAEGKARDLAARKLPDIPPKH